MGRRVGRATWKQRLVQLFATRYTLGCLLGPDDAVPDAGSERRHANRGTKQVKNIQV